MTHDYHEGLPGYHADQILHDGCAECEDRVKSRGAGISHLDKTRFARAWKRAADWQNGDAPAIAKAEVPLLDALWAVQVQLEKFGVPIGEVPG